MNKTVTINVSGIIFHIEEEAYEKLSKYLATIKGYFSKTDGGNEIMADIEARVAELLQEKINPGKQVILLSDVEYVIQTLGRPEEFSDSTSTAQNTETASEEPLRQTSEKIKKRLFRDPDDKAIGGVCGGLAAYFDIEVVWLRLAMFLLIFFGGVSLWVYLVLWMIIPKARTTADKLAMRGESANINNIMKNFKEEAEDLKNRANKYGKEVRTSNYGEAVRQNAATAVGVAANIFGRIIGFFILCIGIALFIGYIASLTGLSVLNTHNRLASWKAVIFESPSDYAFGVIAFIIVLGIPIIMLIYAGVKLLFRIRYSNRWLNLGLGLLWLTGLIIGLVVAVSTAKNFAQTSKIKQNYELHGIGDTLIITKNASLNQLAEYNPDNELEIEKYMKHKYYGYCFPEYDGKLGIIGYPDINVAESASDSLEMSIVKTSRGSYKRDANENAKEIKYAFTQDKNTLVFDETFFVSAGNKFRKQEVDVRIKLPKGRVIYFDESVKHLLYDIDNTTNTWDGDMAGHYWKMTDKGLTCLDCKESDSADDEDEEENKHVIINNKGIKVNGDDAQIRIDENGIKVKGKDTQIKIDSNGIDIKTPNETK